MENQTNTSEEIKNPTAKYMYVLAGFVTLAVAILVIVTNSNRSSLGQAIKSNKVEGASAMASSDPNVSVFQVEGGMFYYKPNEIRVKKGSSVKIVFTNVEGRHDFKIDEFNFRIGPTSAGQTTEGTFIADKSGTFQFYCSVPGHREKGMVGNLIVE